MYVYCTNSFNNELNKNKDLSLRVANFYSKLEASTFLEAQEKFERIHSYLKRKEGTFRLIAKIMKIDRESIICFLKVYGRGDAEYRRFLDDVKNKNDLFQESQLNSELSNWLIAQKSDRPQIINTTLKDDLRIWLQRPDWNINTEEFIIHESELWSQKFADPKIRLQALVYRQIIEDLIAEISNITVVNFTNNFATQWDSVYYYGRDNCYIIYSNLKTKDETQEKVLLLIAPLLGIPNEAIINDIVEPLIDSHINFNWWQKRHDLRLDDLITYTKRSYPWYLISDENFWLRIQDGNGVNLALSTEEKELLHSVSTQNSLPLFLNGRAGSGKSTMLFYLFAYYCHRHLQFCRENQKKFLAKPHPLFITYSPNLSESARIKVQSILEYHHYFLEETEDLEKLPNLNLFFKSFRVFLRKLLPITETNSFLEENHVSFYRFRELFGSRWKNLSPEKCWLVIQNFIKGYELINKDSYLDTIEKYQQIPLKEQTVTAEEFTEIRNTVWYWYYKYTQENNLWDDRDLVRTILDFGYYKPEYTVIFCDEAQDFTRLELQLIMKLSVFSLYNLERETIFSLPFAFAGDPLQTLNPTGFRWSNFKAAFYDEVLIPLKLEKQSQFELKLQQLKDNYRSAAAIVKVNNLIQLWRKILFNFSDIEPQKAKKDNNFIPQKFIIGKNITLEDVKKTLKDTIILIPCDEGAEKDFIERDSFLKSLDNDSNIDTPWNILSAISAKGSEFKQVILYRFGEACTLDLSGNQIVAGEKHKYFLNKLYVAASRATEKLFIIDSIAGDKALWNYTSDRKYLDNFLRQIEDLETRKQWQDNTELITSGSSLLDLSNNIEADALTFETVGINTENINFLNRAIAAYQRSRNKQKSNFCLAWKLKLERNYIAAGELFLKLNKLTDSWCCFWQGLAWDKLQQLLKDYETDNNNYNGEIANFKLLSSLVDFMVKVSTARQQNITKLSPQDIIEVTNFLVAELSQNNLIEERESKPWQVFFNTYLSQIQTLCSYPQTITQNYWLTIANILIEYTEEKSNYAKQLIAYCFYFGKNYDLAIQYWEEIEYDSDSSSMVLAEPKYYYLAKAKLAQFPQRLEYLYQGKQYQTIIARWLKSTTKLEPIWLEYVALAFEATEQYYYASIAYSQLDRCDKVKQCWLKIPNKSFTFKQIKQLIHYYFKQQYWAEAIDFARHKLDNINFQSYFIYCLARSKLQPNKLTKSQRQHYQVFIENNLLSNSYWQRYLTIEQLGIALEKIGSFMTTLSFYERFVNSNNQQLSKFARDRWIVTKYRQIKYFQQTANLSKVKKSQNNLENKAQKWNINLSTLSQSSSEIGSIAPVKQARSSSVVVTGLPQDTKTKTLPKNIQQFQFQYLLLRIAKASQKLAIINLLNRQVVKIDWRKGKMQKDSVTIVSPGNQPIYFSDTQGKYKGILWRDLEPRLELKLDNYPTLITIKFSHL